MIESLLANFISLPLATKAIIVAAVAIIVQAGVLYYDKVAHPKRAGKTPLSTRAYLGQAAGYSLLIIIAIGGFAIYKTLWP